MFGQGPTQWCTFCPAGAACGICGLQQTGKKPTAFSPTTLWNGEFRTEMFLVISWFNSGTFR